jgi:hypothetical protein
LQFLPNLIICPFKLCKFVKKHISENPVEAVFMQLAVTVSSIAQCLKQYMACTLSFLLTYMRKKEQTGHLGVSKHAVKLACS